MLSDVTRRFESLDITVNYNYLLIYYTAVIIEVSSRQRNITSSVLFTNWNIGI